MKHEGFSLLEVMLAATMLFIGIIVVMSSLSSSWTINSITEEQTMAIAALAHQAEILKSMDILQLNTLFGGSISEGKTATFPVDGLVAMDGSDNPAGGTLLCHLVDDPDSPGTPLLPEELLEVHIRIDFLSDLDGPTAEEVTIWISPSN